jgi:hypothetical protein
MCFQVRTTEPGEFKKMCSVCAGSCGVKARQLWRQFSNEQQRSEESLKIHPWEIFKNLIDLYLYKINEVLSLREVLITWVYY